MRLWKSPDEGILNLFLDRIFEDCGNSPYDFEKFLTNYNGEFHSKQDDLDLIDDLEADKDLLEAEIKSLKEYVKVLEESKLNFEDIVKKLDKEIEEMKRTLEQSIVLSV